MLLFKINCAINFYRISYSSDLAIVLFYFFPFCRIFGGWRNQDMSVGGLRLSYVKSYSILTIFLANLLQK
jgi:hypothetical protein